MDQLQTAQTPQASQIPLTDRQMLEEIYKDTIKTKNYMKWQLIITVALVVIPILASMILIPLALSSLSSLGGAYTGGVLQ
mgnify:CR=1 FL=1